ncbi:hypothetical protein C3450_14460 [Escherichia coli]|nr:hypothetical protein C3450_14460 [Escherichia coli]
MGQEQLELQSSFQQLFFMGSEPGFPPRIKLKPFQGYTITSAGTFSLNSTCPGLSKRISNEHPSFLAGAFCAAGDCFWLK